MTWNLSNVISALGKFSLIPASNAAPMSMLASVTASRRRRGLQELLELLYRRGVLAFGDIDHLAPRHIDEQADVVVAAPRRGLISRDAPHFGQIQRLHRAPHVMLDDAPQPRVVLAHPLGRIGDRHRLGQRQHISLEQQREARARPRPGRGDLAHAAIRARHSGRACVQICAMLEEIQMPPRIVLRVVNRAAFPPAIRAGEPAPARKIHIQIESTVLDVELAARHRPRRRKPKGQLKKIGVSHPQAINSIPTAIANPPQNPTLPTQFSEEPSAQARRAA